MVQLELYVPTPAVCATALVSFEDVGAYLPAEQGAALVLHAFHVGVGSSCRFGRQWYAIVAFGSFLVSVVSDVGLW